MFKRVFVAMIVFANMVFMPDCSGIDGIVQEFKTETKCDHVSVVVYDHGELTYYGDKEGLYQI